MAAGRGNTGMLHVLDGHQEDGLVLPAEHDQAIVTLCIGDRHQRLWDQMCRSSWLAYAARHGYDVVLITAPLDQSPLASSRSPAWQQCLVLDQPWARQYQRIVWLDADIIIASPARDIVSTVPDPALIGVCATGAQLSRAELHVYLERFHTISIGPDQVDLLWQMHVGNQFSHAGLPPGEATMFNTGVLVLSPPHHAALLRGVYDRGDPDNTLGQQPALSQAISRHGPHAPLSARFNWSMHEALLLRFTSPPAPPLSRQQAQDLLSFVVDEMHKAYFIHFSGCLPLLCTLAGLRSAQQVPAQPVPA
jgi:hypothetical protein